MIDLVYTFRYDRGAWNKQLRYSLRSVEKHLTGVRNVYVVGFRPNLPGVIHVEHSDNSSATKNIMAKLQHVARMDEVSENFLYMADDHFMLEDFSEWLYPTYSNGCLKELFKTQNNSYKMMVKSTFESLEERGFPTINYNVHCPVIYNKANLIRLSEMFNMDKPLGYLAKSLYLNVFPPERSVPLKDCKLSKNIPLEEMKKKIHGRDCFSTGKEKDCPNIDLLLEELYPNKSKYE